VCPFSACLTTRLQHLLLPPLLLTAAAAAAAAAGEAGKDSQKPAR